MTRTLKITPAPLGYHLSRVTVQPSTRTRWGNYTKANVRIERLSFHATATLAILALVCEVWKQ